MYTETLTMAKYCVGCGEQIHPKRVEILPHTKTCVECSNTGMKRGITVLNGDVEKDDTWVDMVFVEEDEYREYENQNKSLSNKKSSKAEMQNYDDDDNVSIPSSFSEEE
jgi:hypothetical protein